jgi:hypothetical protein
VPWYPTQAKERLEWGTQTFVAAETVAFIQASPLKSPVVNRKGVDPIVEEVRALNSAQHANRKRDQGDHQLQRSVHGDAGQPERQ